MTSPFERRKTRLHGRIDPHPRMRCLCSANGTHTFAVARYAQSSISTSTSPSSGKTARQETRASVTKRGTLCGSIRGYLKRNLALIARHQRAHGWVRCFVCDTQVNPDEDGMVHNGGGITLHLPAFGIDADCPPAKKEAELPPCSQEPHLRCLLLPERGVRRAPPTASDGRNRAASTYSEGQAVLD